MNEKIILIIHPNDKTTSFLGRIKNYLVQKFEDRIHHFNIHPNNQSHNQCLERIKIHSNKGIIIFLGHGITTQLYGAKGDLYGNEDFTNKEAVLETPEKYYSNDNFIHQDNVEVFAGKKVFCLACNSNDKIASFALEKGAVAFLGFGNIPTSIREFADDGLKGIGNNMVKMMKTELNYIIKRSLEISIERNYSFNQLCDLIHFITNQRISYYLRIDKNFKLRHILVDYLYRLKSDIRILGDRKIRLIEQ